MTSTLSDSLTRLAQSMESLRPAGAQPAWAELIGPLEQPEEVRWHPDIETMIGFVASPRCPALATVGYGWARGLDDSCEVLQPGERRRARVVCLMTRAGDTAGYLCDSSKVVREPPTVGRVLDIMRRALALPTPPPEFPTDVLLARIWLNNVLGRAGTAERRLAWRDVAHLHPVIEVAAAGGIDVPAAQFPRIMQVGAEVWNWSYLLAQAASPGWVADLLPPGTSGWMDEGILSRWLLDAIPEADGLLDRVIALIEPAAAKRLRSTLTRLGAMAGG